MKSNTLKSQALGALANFALLLASCLATLLLVEAALRLFLPKYRDLAEAWYVMDAETHFQRRIPNSLDFWEHADTALEHSVFANNLALRQHRNFSLADLESSVNVGVFGDSFTENFYLPVQFSFTEPLDYLVNLEERGGRTVNVLNFGSGRNATAHSLLRYEQWPHRETLDHTFYVYCWNDLKHNVKTDLYRLDDAGDLVRGAAAPSRFSILSKLHLSYLALDVSGRLSLYLERQRDIHSSGDPVLDIELFRQMLRRWKEVAEGDGATFQVVWLPVKKPEPVHERYGISDIVREEGIGIVDLEDCFGKFDPTHLNTTWDDSPYKFERDDHWNEAGNRLAAMCLHRFLEGRLGLPRLSEDEVEQALHRYYSAFEGRMADLAAPAAAIRRKYAALDLAREGNQASPAPPPGERVIRSGFDVYLHDGWLAYFKEGCASADASPGFFLHVYPRNVQDLPAPRREFGFDNLDFHYLFDESTCTAWRKLPGYPIDRIVTGQSAWEGGEVWKPLWEGEHVLFPPGNLTEVSG